jgi:hypothetical protein
MRDQEETPVGASLTQQLGRRCGKKPRRRLEKAFAAVGVEFCR